MAASYASHVDVAALIGIDGFPSSGSPVTSTIVDQWIEQYEDYVNSRTMDSWKSVTVTEELYDYLGRSYRSGLGVPVFVNHTDLFTFSSAEGDKIEVWDGGSWVDWLASSSYTEGRENDYFIDYARGVIWMKDGFVNKPQNIRLTYRYGDKTVPGDIKDAVVLLTAARIMDMDGTHALIAEGGSDIPPKSAADRWVEEAKETIRNYRGFRALGPISQ